MKLDDRSHINLEMSGNQARAGLAAGYEECVLAALPENLHKHRQSLIALTKPLISGTGAPPLDSMRCTVADATVYELERYRHLFGQESELLIGRYCGDMGDNTHPQQERLTAREVLRRVSQYLDFQGKHHAPAIAEHLLTVVQNVSESSGLKGPVFFHGEEYSLRLQFTAKVGQDDLLSLQFKIATPSTEYARRIDSRAKGVTQ